MTVVTIVIVAVIVIAGIFLVLKITTKNSASVEKEAAVSSVPQKESAETEFEKIMGTLLKLNILIRTDTRLDSEMLSTIESIIDDLKATIPPMMEKYPGETLTYELKKIGSSHLYNNVKEYLDLSDESRVTQLSIFNNTLASLNEVSKRARDIAEKNETQEFKTMATFLKTKFQTDIGS
ncbi:MAG: hypothetical protein K8R67_03115 [Desulfobacteraceae bacterium]|nr:hypothetical protein [Desulfobacteraceae bacterium]